LYRTPTEINLGGRPPIFATGFARMALKSNSLPAVAGECKFVKEKLRLSATLFIVLSFWVEPLQPAMFTQAKPVRAKPVAEPVQRCHKLSTKTTKH